MSKIDVTMVYNGVRITMPELPKRDIGIFSLVYKDVRSKQADTLDLQINDLSWRWKDENIPKKNDKIVFELRTARHVLITPPFYVDGIDWDEPTSTVRIRMLNYIYSQKSKVKQKRSVNYGDTTIRNLVGAIAQRNKLKLLWFGNDAPITNCKQYKTSDYSFLAKLARETGAFFKFMKGQLIWGSEADGYTFTRNGGEVTTTEEGSGSRYIEIAPDEISRVQFSLKSNKKNSIAFEPITAINKKLDRVFARRSTDFEAGPVVSTDLITSVDQAAKGALTQLVRGELDVNLTIPIIDSIGPLAQELLAGSLIYIYDFGLLSGTYVIEEARHTAATQRGWIADLKCTRLNSKQLTRPKRKRKKRERKKVEKTTATKKAETKAAATAKKPVGAISDSAVTTDYTELGTITQSDYADQAKKEFGFSSTESDGVSADDYNGDGSATYDNDSIGGIGTGDG